jgi:hypothetical protein
MTIGMAFVTVSTPPPTMPTTIDVVDDELCISDVAKTPINSPTKGFDVVAIRLSANSLPKILNEAPINPILRRKI